MTSMLLGVRARLAQAVAVCGAVALVLVGMAPGAAAESVRDRQWYLDMLNAAKAHQITQGQGITVAVVGTGVDANHPDLQGSVLSGKSFAKPSEKSIAEKGHGTAVAALIAAHGGALGLAPEAKLLPIRVGNNANDVAKGIRWAVDHGAKIINLSLAYVSKSRILTNAVAYALSRDVVVVAGAGNAFSVNGKIGYPAQTPGVIAVSGVNRSGRFAKNHSVKGQGVTLAAPGANILTAQHSGGYLTESGTSLSTPLVAAAATLVRARYPKMRAPDVVNRLIRTAVDQGASGKDPKYGYGVVNPVGALTADVPRVSKNPLGTPEVREERGGSGLADPSSGGGGAGSGDSGAGTLVLAGVVALAMLLLVVVLVVVFLMRRRGGSRTRPAGPPGTQQQGPPGPPGPPGMPPQGPPPGYPPQGPPPGPPPQPRR